MDPDTRKRWSKRLSYHLRHAPAELGLTLAPGGWVEVGDLLAALDKKYRGGLSRQELEEIVATNDKRRFGFDADGARIRANQGHSSTSTCSSRPPSRRRSSTTAPPPASSRPSARRGSRRRGATPSTSRATRRPPAPSGRATGRRWC